MAMTYKKIAELAGVSRATVDRVLNNRGKVDPETEKRVRKVAEEHGFQPNHLGRALARAKNPIKIGVLIHLTRIPFFMRVLEGINDAQKELSNLGARIVISKQENFDADEQLKALNELVEEGVEGIAISPAQDIRIRDRLNELIEKENIPVVTFNTDLEGVKRLAYIGVDNVRIGRTIAHLTDLLLHGKGGKILLISGFITHQTNYQRIDGFLSECGMYYPSIEVAAIEMTYDDEQKVYEATAQALKDIPDLKGICMVSSGHAGCCRAIEDAGKVGKVKVVMVDSLPDTDYYLEKGVIQFVVDQDAYIQGYLPPKMLFENSFYDKIITTEDKFRNIGIKTKYTI